MFVILNPSPCVTLSEAKGLAFWLRVNSVKNLVSSFALLRTCFPAGGQGLTPQNDIVTQSLDGGGCVRVAAGSGSAPEGEPLARRGVDN